MKLNPLNVNFDRNKIRSFFFFLFSDDNILGYCDCFGDNEGGYSGVGGGGWCSYCGVGFVAVEMEVTGVVVVLMEIDFVVVVVVMEVASEVVVVVMYVEVLHLL